MSSLKVYMYSDEQFTPINGLVSGNILHPRAHMSLVEWEIAEIKLQDQCLKYIPKTLFAFK